MANPLATNLWTTCPLFYGHSARKDHDLSAEEFLERQEALMLTNQPAAGGPAKVTATVGSFRGEARTWWTKTLPYSEDNAVIVNLTANWEDFRKRFVAEYYPFSRTADATINWVSFSQKPGESVYLFLSRVNNAASQFGVLVKDPVADAAPVAATPHGLEPASVGEVFFLTGGAPEQQNLKEQIHDMKKKFRDIFLRRYSGCVVAKVVLNGLRENRLRPILLKCITDGDSVADMMQKVRVAESHLPAQKQPQGRIAAVAEEDNSPDGIDKVNAIKAKGKGKGKGKSGAKGKPRAGPDTTKSCDYCHRLGHIEKDCFTKKNASREQRGNRSKESGPTPGVSSARGSSDRRGDDPPDEDDLASAALNSMLIL
jgi:hypothetical protein